MPCTPILASEAQSEMTTIPLLFATVAAAAPMS